MSGGGDEEPAAVVLLAAASRSFLALFAGGGIPELLADTLMLSDMLMAASIWLSKRLVERFAAWRLPRDAVERDVRAQLDRVEMSPSWSWAGVLLDVPQEKQIGPCCGLAAVRCVQAYYYWDKDDVHNDLDCAVFTPAAAASAICRMPCELTLPASAPTAGASSSLLAFARENGFTSDGEMFNALNLARVASSPSGGLASTVLTGMTAAALIGLVQAGVPVLAAFDKSQGHQHMTVENSGGSRAHWGILRGVCWPVLASEERAGEKGGVRWGGGHAQKRYDPEFGRDEDADKLLMVAIQHTLSEFVSVVPFTRFVASNAQLDGAGHMLTETQLQRIDALDALGYVRQGKALARRWVVLTPRPLP